MAHNYVVLEISSFQGVSFGAVHFYGKLKGNKGENFTHVAISKRMTQEEADWFNKKDGYGSLYEKGDKTNRFNNKNDIREESIKLWRKEFPDAEFLLEGQYALAEPMKCLDAKDFEAKVQLNNIWYDYIQIPRDIDDYDRSEANWEKVEKAWRAYDKVLKHGK